MNLELALLAVFAFFAGFVDAVVGGGGLIQIPALFTVFPQTPVGVLFGTNKFASIFGTGAATLRYMRGLRLRWSMLLPAAAGALVFSFLGARVVTMLPTEIVRPVVLVLLVAVASYTLRKKDFGSIHVPRIEAGPEKWLGFATGAALGFYDGFFGPGTGTFLIFIFIRFFGYDFLHASASAKVINTATNLAALVYFIPTGNIFWLAAAIMAIANIGGSFAGTHLALRQGAIFVRRLFLIVLAAIILKFSYDTLKILAA